MTRRKIISETGQKGFTLRKLTSRVRTPLNKKFSWVGQKGFNFLKNPLRVKIHLNKTFSLAGQNGFSLLETMIGLAILAGVIVTVLASLNYNLGVSSYDMDLVSATMLGRELAEQSSLDKSVTDGRGTFTGPLSKFSWTVNNEPTGFSDLERVTVKVLWDKDKDVTFLSFKRK